VNLGFLHSSLTEGLDAFPANSINPGMRAIGDIEALGGSESSRSTGGIGVTRDIGDICPVGMSVSV